MSDVLVLRFGSLGDLCLLGWSLSALADEPEARNRRVTLVTKQGFAPLAARLHGVDEVVPLKDGTVGALARLSANLKRRRWDTVIDAHHVLRSHLLLAMMGRRPAARLAKDTGARLKLLRGGSDDPRLQRSMVDRFDEVLACLRAAAPERGTPPVARPPLSSLRTSEPGSRGPVALAPGARWSTKRWPDHAWAALLEGLAGEGAVDIRIFLGPDERAWFAGSRLASVAAAAGATVIAGRDLTDVAASLAQCRVLATNDSGLLHVAEAVGTPVLAFFGPTVRAFGYFPRLPHSLVLESEIACRPCSRNGKRACHRGDLACLERITPAIALAALRDMRSCP